MYRSTAVVNSLPQSAAQCQLQSAVCCFERPAAISLVRTTEATLCALRTQREAERSPPQYKTHTGYERGVSCENLGNSDSSLIERPSTCGHESEGMENHSSDRCVAPAPNNLPRDNHNSTGSDNNNIHNAKNNDSTHNNNYMPNYTIAPRTDKEDGHRPSPATGETSAAGSPEVGSPGGCNLTNPDMKKTTLDGGAVSSMSLFSRSCLTGGEVAADSAGFKEPKVGQVSDVAGSRLVNTCICLFVFVKTINPKDPEWIPPLPHEPPSRDKSEGMPFIERASFPSQQNRIVLASHG